MDCVVLASHLEGEGTFRSQKYEVLPWLCRDDLDYWRGYASLWESDRTIIGLEHDVEITDDHIADLLACPSILCLAPYPMHWCCTGMFEDVWPARNNGLFVKGGEPTAEQAAIGFCKITPEARIGPLEEAPWNRLEVSIEKAVQRPWCLRWFDPPLRHHHW